MANPFVHVELNTADVAKAKSFYGELFDWELEDMPMSEGSYNPDQGGRWNLWRADATPDAGRTVNVAGLCVGRRHQDGNR
jgi:hypothetical protein